MIDDFKKFLFRGNVIDLAVAVIIGVAFTAIVAAISTGLITPLVGMIVGKDFSDMTFTLNGSVFYYGLVIDAVIQFVSIAAVVFLVVVKPAQALAARRASGDGGHAGPERRGAAPDRDPRPPPPANVMPRRLSDAERPVVGSPSGPAANVPAVGRGANVARRHRRVWSGRLRPGADPRGPSATPSR